MSWVQFPSGKPVTKPELEKYLNRPLSDEEYGRYVAAQQPPGQGVMANPQGAYFDQKTNTWVDMQPYAAPPQPLTQAQKDQMLVQGGQDGSMVFGRPTNQQTVANKPQATPYVDPAWEMNALLQDQAEQEHAIRQAQIDAEAKAQSKPGQTSMGQVLMSKPKLVGRDKSTRVKA